LQEQQVKLPGGQTMSQRFDVIVVGGGPAGSVAAASCAQAGFSVALFEHKTFPRHKVCGDVINPGCWPIFESLDVAGKIRALPQHAVTAAQFTTSDGAMVDVPMRACTIRRSELDTALLQHARTCGVTVFEGEAVRDIARSSEVFTSNDRYIASRGIIGADGRHSVVATRAGLRRGTGRNGHIAFQADFRAPTTMNDAVQLHLFPNGYCGVVRVDGERVNVCIVTDRAGARNHDDCEALFERTVCQNRQFRALGIAPEPLGPLQSVHPLVTSLNVPHRDRVWLVGDALRTTEPFTGQGIFFALQTARLAAECIRTGSDYAAAVQRLYARRGRTNALLRRLMYREALASPAIRALRRSPSIVRWLADNVLAGRPVPATIARR
jgi:flavin-dependent dehydrogenase